ncbi:DUF362 domain-containing protein [Methanothrix sp.]|uniref:DUF362 domain-containing protein n=1 Tax=Methanothrix sp. TaxID=90426 RepID=UPI003BB71C63
MERYSAYISHITNLRDDLLKSLEFVDWKSQVEKGSTVFVKPNFTYPYYKEGITTSPELLKFFLEILKDRAGEVIVGESNGGNNSFTADDAFKGHNMHEICRETGATLVNLSRIPSMPVEETIQGRKVKVFLPELLVNDIDCFISVPVLKVHVMTTVTLSIKNLWGCYPDTMRCLHHQNLSRKLTLITKTLNPRLVVIDGTYALDGHGPMYGVAKKANLIISSNNPVVADSLGTAVMGIPLQDVESIRIASSQGLGITDLSKVRLNDDWKKFSMEFHVKRTLVDNLSSLLFRSEAIAKIVMCSPLTPIAYGLVKHLRNSQEQTVVDELKTY